MITSPTQAGALGNVVRTANRVRRDQTILALRARGKTIAQIAAKLEITERSVYASLRRGGAEIQKIIADEIQRDAIDADSLLCTLTDQINGDLAELYWMRDRDGDAMPSDAVEGDLKPVAAWPLWARQGGVEILDEPNMVPSADGSGASWDQQGRKIRIKMGSRAKIYELALRHKTVDGLAAQKQDINAKLTVSVEQQRADMAAARERVAKVIEITAEPSEGER